MTTWIQKFHGFVTGRKVGDTVGVLALCRVNLSSL